MLAGKGIIKREISQVLRELEQVAIACTNVTLGGAVRLVITQIFCVPMETLLRRGATVEFRPALMVFEN